MSIQIRTDCLDTVFGLTRAECECFESDIAAEESESGLYLDELEGLDLKVIQAATDCADNNLLTLMQKAREQAIIGFKTDWPVTIANYWQQLKPVFDGQIGQTKFTTNQLGVNNYAGHRYVMAPVKNGVFTIKRLGLTFETTGTVNVLIYNNVSDTPLFTLLNVPTEAGKTKWYTPAVDISLPMYSQDCEYLEYYILYANPGFAPKATGFKCCSTSISFNCVNPAFGNPNADQRYDFLKWSNVTGVTGASVSDIKNGSNVYNNHAMGLALDASMRCNVRSIACNDLDYVNGTIGMVIAHTIRFRAGVYLCNAILSSNNINRYTMLDREALYGKRNHYTKEYNNRLEWLSNPDVSDVRQFLTNTGCYMCSSRMKVISIL